MIGAIDGVNVVFTVSRPYSPGTVAVFLNGLLQERELDDGFEEADAAAGIIRMKEPPEPSPLGDDVLQAFFLESTRPVPETIMCRVRTSLRSSARYQVSARSSTVRYQASVRGLPVRYQASMRSAPVRYRALIRSSPAKYRVTVRICSG